MVIPYLLYTSQLVSGVDLPQEQLSAHNGELNGKMGRQSISSVEMATIVFDVMETLRGNSRFLEVFNGMV